LRSGFQRWKKFRVRCRVPSETWRRLSDEGSDELELEGLTLLTLTLKLRDEASTGTVIRVLATVVYLETLTVAVGGARRAGSGHAATGITVFYRI
jgi:transcriptional antiterminator Rof (Rho-off)